MKCPECVFGAHSVFHVVEHGRDEEDLKSKWAGVKRPECRLCARNVFYVVEHIGALAHNYIISKA